MTFHNFDELIKSVQKDKSTKVVAVVAADDRHTLEAVCRAKKNNIASPILLGNRQKIRAELEELNEDAAGFEMIHVEDGPAAAREAVSLIRNGKADFLMKGKIQTADMMHPVVDKENGLNACRSMSMIAFFQLPQYHKLFVVTDGGMMMYPSLDEKKHIIQNAVDLYHSLGIENPKVAVLAAVEFANPKMTEAMDAAALKRMYQTGEISGCIIEGPISYDLAMSHESAKIKCYQSPVCGDADILIVPNITAGNILGKALVLSAKATMAGLVVGATAPIALTSRGSSAQEKYLSLVLCAASV